MRRPLLVAFAAVLTTVLVFTSTPVGVWTAARVAERLAPEYGLQLDVGAAAGSLLGVAELREFSLRDSEGTFHVVGPSLSVSLWDRALTVESPQVELRLAAGEVPPAGDPEPIGAITLPVAELPTVSVSNGRIDLAYGDSLHLAAAGVTLHYEPPLSTQQQTSGRLQVDAPELLLSAGADTLAAALGCALAVGADRLTTRTLEIRGGSGETIVQSTAAVTLEFSETFPLDTDARIQLRSADRRADFHVVLAGGLQPLQLDLSASAVATDSTWGEADLSLSGAIDTEHVTLDSVWIDSPHGRAFLTGALAFAESDRFELIAAVSEVDVKALTGGVVDGELTGNARVNGQLATAAIEADLQAELAGIESLPGPPLDLHLDARLNDSLLVATLESNVGALTTRGYADLDGEIDLTVEGEVNAGHFFGVQMPVEIAGELTTDAMDILVSADRLPFLEGEFGRTQLHLELREGSQLQVELTLEEEQLQADMRGDLGAGEVEQLRAIVNPLALERLTPALSGTVAATLSAGGALDLGHAHATARIEMAEVSYAGWEVDDATLNLSLNGGVATATLESSGLQLEARVDTSGLFRARCELDSAMLTRSVGGTHPADSLTLSGTLGAEGFAGQLEKVRAQATFSDARLLIGGWSIVSQDTVRVSHDDALTQLQPARFETPLGLLRVAGALADSVELSAAIDSLTPGGIDHNLGGSGSLRARVRGRRTAPRVEAEISFGDLTLQGNRLGSGQISASYGDSIAATVWMRQPGVRGDRRPSGETSEHDGGELVARLSAVSTALQTGTDSVHFELAARHLDVGPLLTYALGDSVAAVIGARSSLAIELARLDSGFSWRDLRGGIAVDELSLSKGALRLTAPAEGVEFLFGDSAPQTAHFPLARRDRETQQFTRPAGTVRLQAEQSAAAVRAQLSLEQLDLLAAGALGFDDALVPAGAIDAALTLTDSAGTRAVTLAADAVLDDFGDVAAQLTTHKDTGFAQLLWTTPLADEVAVAVELPWNSHTGELSWEQAHLTARSDGVNLFVFLDQLPQLDRLDGLVRLDIATTGLDSNAEVRGFVEIEEVELALLDVKPGYLFPAGRLDLDGRRGEISLAGRPTRGKGTVALSGHVAAAAADVDYALDLKVSGLPYAYDDVFEVQRLHADLRFHGRTGSSLLEGEVRLDNAAAEAPLVNLTAPPVPPPPPALQSPFLESTQLNVQADIRNMAVRNELTDLVLDGSARMYGTFYKPRFQGELVVGEGRVIALNNEFEFTKGRVILDQLVPTYSLLDLAYDPLLLDPELDMEAVAAVRDVAEDDPRDVTMTLRGRAKRATPVFSSAGLDDGQVFFLLAFNTTETAGVRGRELYTAAGTAVGQLLLSRQVQRIGLDEFQLLPSGTVLGTVGQPAVRLGKYFTWPLPLWVRYEAITREPAIGEAQVEYKVTRFLTVRADAHSEYELYGVGIGLVKEF